MSSSAPQNGKHCLRRIPERRVSPSPGLAGGLPQRICPAHRTLVKTFLRMFPQRSAVSDTPSSHEAARLQKHTEPPQSLTHQTLTNCAVSAAAILTRSPPNPFRPRLDNSCHRRGVSNSSGTGETVTYFSLPLEAFPSRRKLRGAFLSEAWSVSPPLTYIPLIDSLPSVGVTPRHLRRFLRNRDALRNAHLREWSFLKNPNRFSGCSRIPS